MAGLISVRVTRAERQKLLALKMERGCRDMSEVIRLMLGFPRGGGPEGFDGADDIDSVGTLAREVLKLRDRVDVATEGIHALLKREGIKQVTHRPIADMLPTADHAEYRNGHQHPALPEGFKRA